MPRHLIVQIPCYNESATIQGVIRSVPKTIDGIDAISVLVVDDGSGDDTAQLAEQAGAHVVRLEHNSGLANAFRTGLRESLQLGADIIITMDGDHQYRGEDIPALLQPILHEDADIVIGDRQVQSGHFYTLTKKRCHALGCWFLKHGMRVDSCDPVSGFRAMRRSAAQQITITGSFSYTLEMLIHATQLGLNITYVPVQVNGPLRPSRLFGSNASFMLRSAATALRLWLRIVFYSSKW